MAAFQHQDPGPQTIISGTCSLPALSSVVASLSGRFAIPSLRLFPTRSQLEDDVLRVWQSHQKGYTCGFPGSPGGSPEEGSHWTSWSQGTIPEPITKAKPMEYADWPDPSHMTASVAPGLRSRSLGLRCSKGLCAENPCRRKPHMSTAKSGVLLSLGCSLCICLALSCLEVDMLCQTQKKVQAPIWQPVD